MKPFETGRSVLLALITGIGIGIGLNHLAVRVASAAPEAPKVITAQQILIVDEKGVKRLEIGAESGGASSIVIYDSDGKRRIGIGAEKKGAGVNLFSADGKTLRLAAHLKPDGVAGVTAYDGEGKPKGGFAVNLAGSEGTP